MIYHPNKILGWIIIVTAGVLVTLTYIGIFYLPGEYQIGTDVIIPRSPESTWRWFVHPDNWNNRFSVTYSVEGSSPKEGGVGEQLQIKTNIPGGKKLVSNIVVTDWVKGRVIEDRHQGDWIYDRPLPIMNVRDRFEFKPEGLHKTRVTFKETFNVDGPVNKWLAYLVIKPEADRFLAEVLSEYHQSVKENLVTPIKHG